MLPLIGNSDAIPNDKAFRIRTITAGLNMRSSPGFEQAKAAVAFLEECRARLEAGGYEVQTLRLATEPLPRYLPDWMSAGAIERVRALDRFAVDNGVSCSIGPVIADDLYREGFADWAVGLIESTSNLSFTVSIADGNRGVHYRSQRAAAEAMLAIARGTPGGNGNFRFAANAYTGAGTPFFPAAWFERGQSFSIGLESPNLLRTILESLADPREAPEELRAGLERALRPVERLAIDVATASGWEFLGIDTSPAPGLDASIGQVIETLTGRSFGSASTLSACATITEAIRNPGVKTCGYSGLMLPIMEDPVLARRAAEGRYTLAELLLYSSVCGTGLDVVPIPGDTPVPTIEGILADVAALAHRYRKPLSARLFPAPGKREGETVSFDNPYLTDAVVMAPG